VLAGNGVVRQRAGDALRRFAHATGLRVAETFMGKGLLDVDDPQALGAVGLQAGDYAMAGFGSADLVVAIGYDLVEHDPRFWNPRGEHRIVCIDSLAAEIDAHFVPEVELIGNVAATLDRLAEECGRLDEVGGSDQLRNLVSSWLTRAQHDTTFPMRPPRVLFELRRALGRNDLLISDVGLHKLWIGRMYPAHEPNTVLIANGLAGMGFAVPAAIAAKIVQPDRRVVAVSGDGGFMMNCQELETAVRCGTPFVNLVWENRQFGSIAWKQERRFDRHFGTDFGNPDFVQLGRAFGLPSWRIQSADELGARLAHALTLDEPSLIVVPVDYSLDVSIADEFGEEIIPT
jgi:acetolactate synthase-1/2/3 large subunit